jgi:hypothetical protein
MIDLQPLTNARHKDARSLIVETLSREWPLTAKQVFASLNTSAHAPTYQGVHKALVQLEADGVVEKAAKGYSLSKTWLSQTSDRLNELKMKYASMEETISGDVLYLTFNNAFEVDQFLVAWAKKLHLTKKDKMVLQWNHFWIPLFFPRQTYLEMKEFFESCDPYAITSANTVLDKWCAYYWEKAGLKKRLGVKSKYSSDVIAVRDIVVQVFYPQKLLDKINKVYISVKNIEEFDADIFFNGVFLHPIKIQVVVLRNAGLSMLLQNEINSYFKKNSKTGL